MKSLLSLTISLVGVSILLGGIAAGVVLIKSPQIFKEKAAGTTSLKIDPTTQTKRKGNDFSFNVVMDTGDKTITGFDLRLKFDPVAMQVVSLELGSGATGFTRVYTDKIDNTAGTVGYAYYTMVEKAVKGSALTILKVNAKMKDIVGPGSYEVSILPTSILSSVEDSTNVLQTRLAGNVVVNKIGDVNSDTFINLLDINQLLQDYDNSPPLNPLNDLDESGTINLLDINIILKNYGK